VCGTGCRLGEKQKKPSVLARTAYVGKRNKRKKPLPEWVEILAVFPRRYSVTIEPV
jgi:hypothetical protein